MKLQEIIGLFKDRKANLPGVKRLNVLTEDLNKINTGDFRAKISYADEVTEKGTQLESSFFQQYTKEIFNLIYPVNSIFITAAEDDPNELYGGVWEKIPNNYYIKTGGDSENIYNNNSNTYNTGSIKLSKEQIPTLPITVGTETLKGYAGHMLVQSKDLNPGTRHSGICVTVPRGGQNVVFSASSIKSIYTAQANHGSNIPEDSIYIDASHNHTANYNNTSQKNIDIEPNHINFNMWIRKELYV